LVFAFGWVKGTSIAVGALVALLALRAWIDERIAAGDPQVWNFHFRLLPAFVERTVTAEGVSWQAEKLGDGFSPWFKIEVHQRKLRIHEWKGPERYSWTDVSPVSAFRRETEIWTQRIGEIRGGVYCDLLLTLRLWRKGKKGGVCLALSLRWSKSWEQRTLIFSAPLDEEMLNERQGTGQEHTDGWYGQSGPDPFWEHLPDWSWEVTREP
jgi:hypothetical protein